MLIPVVLITYFFSDPTDPPMEVYYDDPIVVDPIDLNTTAIPAVNYTTTTPFSPPQTTTTPKLPVYKVTAPPTTTPRPTTTTTTTTRAPATTIRTASSHSYTYTVTRQGQVRVSRPDVIYPPPPFETEPTTTTTTTTRPSVQVHSTTTTQVTTEQHLTRTGSSHSYSYTVSNQGGNTRVTSAAQEHVIYPPPPPFDTTSVPPSSSSTTTTSTTATTTTTTEAPTTTTTSRPTTTPSTTTTSTTTTTTVPPTTPITTTTTTTTTTAAPTPTSTTTTKAPTTTTTSTTTTTTATPVITITESIVTGTTTVSSGSSLQSHPNNVPLYQEVRRDCTEHKVSGLGSGIYLISPDGREPFYVLCDMDTARGGWVVVQRRLNGLEDFHMKNFKAYEGGFGSLHGNFWLGLSYMERIAPVNQDAQTLRIELRGDTCSAAGCSTLRDGFWWGEWEFALGDASQDYMLTVGQTPLAGNMTNPTVGEKNKKWEKDSNGRKFTTNDRDNDLNWELNCAQFRNFGGWWHKDCTALSLNGRYGDKMGIWRNLNYFRDGDEGAYYVKPKKTLMMLRPRL